jgi:solute carrier family 25 aspartate/glutamate transporter 12/13
MNDWVRDHLMNRKGQVSFLRGMFAGACAGASNVFVVNPLEMIKIRIQMAGEERRPQKVSAFKIIRGLGFSGLYKV